MAGHQIAFGDRVRIATRPETEAVGYAGLEGTCMGFTTPSVTGVHVVGDDGSDLAYSIELATGEAVWFSPDLVEFIDYAVGTEISIGGKKLVRGEDSEWYPASDGSPPRTDENPWSGPQAQRPNTL